MKESEIDEQNVAEAIGRSILNNNNKNDCTQKYVSLQGNSFAFEKHKYLNRR